MRLSPMLRSRIMACLFLSFVSETLLAQGWEAVSAEEIEESERKMEAGSSAIILLKKDSRDEEKKTREVYYCIKILNQRGLKYADIEIPFTRNETVDDISARTILPSGEVVDFQGSVFEKSLLKHKRTRWLAKTFTLPRAVPGSIVQYRFRVRAKKDSDLPSSWVIQEPLFVRKTLLRFRPPQQEFMSWRLAGRGLPEGSGLKFLPEEEGDFYRVVLWDLPAYESEAYSPPEEQLKARYHVLKGFGTLLHPEVFWEDVGKSWADHTTRFIGKPSKLRSVLAQIRNPGNPEAMVRSIYAAVQKEIRNLSYEEWYSRKERKREKIRERKSALDVWKYKCGLANEIVMLFVGLCRAAGIGADPVIISERDAQYFDEDLIDPFQLDGLVAVVDLPTGERFCDPGTRHAPFGWLSWEGQGVVGFRLRHQKKKYAEEIKTPIMGSEENRIFRFIQLELSSNGDAIGHLESSYSGQSSVRLKNEVQELNRSQRTKWFQDTIQELLPAAEINDVTWTKLGDLDAPLEFSCDLKIPGLAVLVDSRVILKPDPFPRHSRFPHTQRKHPAVIPYSFSNAVEVQIIPPQGFRLEYHPEDLEQSYPLGEYRRSVTEEDGRIVYRRELQATAAHVRPAAYLHVKRFFDRVAAFDQLNLVIGQAAQR